MATGSRFDIIKRDVPIVELARRLGGNPEQAGRGHQWKSTNFFHGGDNPNGLSIDAERGLWHAFTGDEGGGTVIDMWMTAKGVTDPAQAVEELAEEFGIELPATESADDVTVRRMRNATWSIVNACHDLLMGKTTYEGAQGTVEKARQYLASRGISKDEAVKYRIGVMPEGKLATKFVSDNEADTAALKANGIFNDTYNDNYVPLNGRLTFPAVDIETGEVNGMSGRTLGDKEPKYLNSPASNSFDKSVSLFTAPGSLGMGKGVILAEGQFDVIALSRIYPDYTVGAIMGSALTPQAAQFFTGMEVALVTDGDDAGQKAVLKAAKAADTVGDSVYAIRLPEGQDPFDMVAAGATREDFDSRARDYVTAAAAIIASDNDPADRGGKVASSLSGARATRFIHELASASGESPDALEKRIRTNLATGGAPRVRTSSFSSPRIKELVSASTTWEPSTTRGVLAGLTHLMDTDEGRSLVSELFSVPKRATDNDVLAYLAGGGFTRSTEVDKALVEAMPGTETVDASGLVAFLAAELKKHEANANPRSRVGMDTLAEVSLLQERSRDIESQPAAVARLLDLNIYVKQRDAAAAE